MKKKLILLAICTMNNTQTHLTINITNQDLTEHTKPNKNIFNTVNTLTYSPSVPIERSKKNAVLSSTTPNTWVRVQISRR